MLHSIFFLLRGVGRYLGFWLGNKKRGNNFQRGGPVKEKTMVVSGYGLTFGSLWHCHKMWHIITKCNSSVIKKCEKSLLQNVSGFLLQNATVLLQNATIFRKWDSFIIKVTVLQQLLQNRTFITNCSIYYKILPVQSTIHKFKIRSYFVR